MYQFEDHYYTINKTFLKALGIWPHSKSRLVLLQRMLVIIVTVSFVGMQVTKSAYKLSVFFTTKFDLILFIRTMSFAFPTIIITLKYFVFIFKSETIKILHYHIEEDWKMIQSKLEIEILKKHAHYGRTYTIFAYLYACFMLIGGIIIEFLPFILDVVLPLDKPRSRAVIIKVEYFIPLEYEYFSMQILHELVIMVVYGSVLLATATQLLTFTCHSFGMFKIASHRVEYFIEDTFLHAPDLKKKRAICRSIVQAVIAHRRALEFSDIIISSFNAPYCTIAIFGVLSLSINLFSFVEAATLTKNMEDMVKSCLVTSAHLIYMYVASYIAQKITDSNREIFRLIYGVSWYLMPVSSQKLILFLMQKTSKDFYFTLGYILVGKMESFASLLNSALSYVAVMCSVQ
ncbi:uncharacterized protein LOC109858669 [Pseudomyrmex gracilis]|uniref:uncharacterized protein LOC109858669 n=1 Tax=Pseudomyrmex gracilis TaxID=219809 RepID=UPI000995284E|nr:uncharacterized protein LOC109858669 [Pseudomyrmex gracilis]